MASAGQGCVWYKTIVRVVTSTEPTRTDDELVQDGGEAGFLIDASCVVNRGDATPIEIPHRWV